MPQPQHDAQQLSLSQTPPALLSVCHSPTPLARAPALLDAVTGCSGPLTRSKHSVASDSLNDAHASHTNHCRAAQPELGVGVKQCCQLAQDALALEVLAGGSSVQVLWRVQHTSGEHRIVAWAGVWVYGF